VEITEERFGPLHLAMGRPLDIQERWIVISDEPTDLDTFREYGLRFDIEENFLDDKSNGFQLESSLIRSAPALERLCLVLAITTLYLVSQGTHIVDTGQRRLVDAHWFRGSSYLKIGWNWIRRALSRKGLLNQFTQEEKEQAKGERQCRREAELPEPRQPLNKHVFATMEGKQAAFAHLLDHVEKRDPDGRKPLIALLDGDPYLEDRLLQELTRRGMTDQLEVCILDIIHASEYLWEVATALYGEKGKKRIPWVEAKLYALLDSKVGYLIGSLKQIGTKHQLQPHQENALEKTITYFENHRPMMDYATYLEKGYPIATGVIEGTCGSLVKDRMEDSGMRWSIAGAQVILLQRAVVQNGDWDDFWNFFISP